jgi:hypothetical protein
MVATAQNSNTVLERVAVENIDFTKELTVSSSGLTTAAALAMR